MKTSYNSSFFGFHFTSKLSYYYVYLQLSAPYSSISIFFLFYVYINRSKFELHYLIGQWQLGVALIPSTKRSCGCSDVVGVHKGRY